MPARTRPDLNTGRWKRIRLTVLKRDAYECQMRGPKCTGVATSVDHVIPYAQGGDDNYNNLRAACRTCNTTAGARQERGGKFDLSRSTDRKSVV